MFLTYKQATKNIFIILFPFYSSAYDWVHGDYDLF